MSQFGLSEQILKKIITALAEFEQVDSAYIFGSRAMGNYKKGSDIDIALKGRGVTDAIAQDFHAICEERLPIPYHFDIVGYDSLEEPKLRNHIDEYGIQFYSKS